MTMEWLWYVLGAIFLLMEVFGASGIGLLFAGLGGLTMGILTSLGLFQDVSIYWQLAFFFGISFAWGCVLWKPFQKFITQSEDSYHHMIGQEVIVVGELTSHKEGTVKWGGTAMRAAWSPETPKEKAMAQDGERLVIKCVKQGLLIVSHAHNNETRK